MPRKSRLQKQFEFEKFLCDSRDRAALCESMNCNCGRLVHRDWLKAQLATHFDSKNTYFVTIYLDRDVRCEGQLKTFYVIDSMRAIVRHSKRANINELRLIGFLDIQLREFAGDSLGRAPEWLCHWHLLIRSSENEESIREKLEAQIPGSDHGTRPIDIKKVNRWPFNVGYIIKFPREFKKKLWSEERGQTNRRYPIKGRHRRELESCLSTVSLSDQMVVMGFRKCSSNLVPRPFPKTRKVNLKMLTIGLLPALAAHNQRIRKIDIVAKE